MKNDISFSSLESFESIGSFIKDYFHISNAQLKKSGLSKKFLNRALREKETISLSANIVNYLKINPESEITENIVIENTNDFLILHKPSKVHMHPHSYEDTNTLLNYLVKDYNDLLKVNDTAYDRGLLYRLDYETSGLVIYAKTFELYEEYRKKFSEMVKEKYYLAICSGKLESVTLKNLISYRGERNSTGYVSNHGEYDAFIRVETLDYNEEQDLSLVKVFLFEGIRHQIRIQLANIGHAILGDDLYRGRKADRLYLHCYQYTLGEKSFVDKSLVDFRKFFNFDSKL